MYSLHRTAHGRMADVCGCQRLERFQSIPQTHLSRVSQAPDLQSDSRGALVSLAFFRSCSCTNTSSFFFFVVAFSASTRSQHATSLVGYHKQTSNMESPSPTRCAFFSPVSAQDGLVSTSSFTMPSSGWIRSSTDGVFFDTRNRWKDLSNRPRSA